MRGNDSVNPADDVGKDIVNHMRRHQPDHFIVGFRRLLAVLPIINIHAATLDSVDVMRVLQLADCPADRIAADAKRFHQ
nr:hypothetical protein [Bifidobacterium bifidum]